MRFVLIYIAACAALSVVTAIIIYPIFEPPLESAIRPSPAVAERPEPKTTGKTSRVKSCGTASDCLGKPLATGLDDRFAARVLSTGFERNSAEVIDPPASGKTPLPDEGAL
jgi:hypothetical protein